MNEVTEAKTQQPNIEAMLLGKLEEAIDKVFGTPSKKDDSVSWLDRKDLTFPEILTNSLESLAETQIPEKLISGIWQKLHA